MRKMVFGRKLGRARKSRIALFRGLIRALVLYGKISTTLAKSKSIQGEVDKLVSLGKKGSLSDRRNALKRLGNDRKTVDTLFNKIAPAFKEKMNGFTRIIPLPPRHGDMAEMTRLEWTKEIETSDKKQITRIAKEKEKIVKVETKKAK